MKIILFMGSIVSVAAGMWFGFSFLWALGLTIGGLIAFAVGSVIVRAGQPIGAPQLAQRLSTDCTQYSCNEQRERWGYSSPDGNFKPVCTPDRDNQITGRYSQAPAEAVSTYQWDAALEQARAAVNSRETEQR